MCLPRRKDSAPAAGGGGRRNSYISRCVPRPPGIRGSIRPRRQVQWPRAAAGLAACLLLAAGATLALPQAVPEPPPFYREYPELVSSEDQTLVFTLGTKGTDVFEEETRKETEMRYRQLPGESVPVVEDAGLCRRTAAALARQGIAPDHRGVYRLTPRQMETLYIQAPELALIDPAGYGLHRFPEHHAPVLPGQSDGRRDGCAAMEQ